MAFCEAASADIVEVGGNPEIGRRQVVSREGLGGCNPCQEGRSAPTREGSLPRGQVGGFHPCQEGALSEDFMGL